MTPSDDSGTDELLALAARCEQATGPDRELDRAIAMATGWAHRSGAVWERVLEWERPRYTASLDAAMTLVPEGHSWMLSVGGMAIAQVTDCTGDACTEPPDHDGHAATPALALCAAALRSRTTTREDER